MHVTMFLKGDLILRWYNLHAKDSRVKGHTQNKSYKRAQPWQVGLWWAPDAGLSRLPIHTLKEKKKMEDSRRKWRERKGKEGEEKEQW